MKSTWLSLAAAAMIAALISPPSLGAAGDSLATAKSLYGAAEYEAALQMLDRLSPDEVRVEVRAVAEHRAFCLLALGRQSEAERAIAMMVGIDPLYQPAAELSPRLRGTFRDVRRRILPAVLQEKYTVAKAAFDTRQFVPARDVFNELLALLEDADVQEAISRPPLSDLRTLATGFRDLSVAALVPPPIPARAASAAVLAAPPSRPAPNRIYTADDRAVVPPVAVQQKIPPFPAGATTAMTGVLELLIDESGAVESAFMRVPIQGRFDVQLTRAARAWNFTPATLDGSPVKYRRLVQISVAAGR